MEPPSVVVPDTKLSPSTWSLDVGFMTPIPTFPPPAAMETSPHEDSSFKYRLPLLHVVVVVVVPASSRRFFIFDRSSGEMVEEAVEMMDEALNLEIDEHLEVVTMGSKSFCSRSLFVHQLQEH